MPKADKAARFALIVADLDKAAKRAVEAGTVDAGAVDINGETLQNVHSAEYLRHVEYLHRQMSLFSVQIIQRLHVWRHDDISSEPALWRRLGKAITARQPLDVAICAMMLYYLMEDRKK